MHKALIPMKTNEENEKAEEEDEDEDEEEEEEKKEEEEDEEEEEEEEEDEEEEEKEEEEDEDEEEEDEEEAPRFIDREQARNAFHLGVTQGHMGMIDPLRVATGHVKKITDENRIDILVGMIMCRMPIPNRNKIAELVAVCTMFRTLELN